MPSGMAGWSLRHDAQALGGSRIRRRLSINKVLIGVELVLGEPELQREQCALGLAQFFVKAIALGDRSLTRTASAWLSSEASGIAPTWPTISASLMQA